MGSAKQRAVDEHGRDRDRVVEAFTRDAELSLARQDPGMSPQERLDQLIEMQRFASQLAEVGRKPPRRAR